jgi:hypothetical protein
MKKLLFTSLFLLSLAFAGFSQTIPPPYINYQAVLYDVNGANPNSPLTNQSFSTFVNINDELGNLLYREEHYASTDANGLITVKMGDGLYTAGPITNFNLINWGVGKYYLVVDFNINGTISSTAPEQLVTVPYSFYAGNAGNGMTAVADNGNGTLTFTYANGQTYITPALSGITGPVGATGQNGLNALIKTTSEAAGANCINGGTKIETGLDANGNGVLDAGEVNASQTTFICNSFSNSVIGNGMAIGKGDYYGGGIVSYIFQPGDLGYDPLQLHGIIAAPFDQCTGCRMKSNSYADWVGPTSTQSNFGSGFANTNYMLQLWGGEAEAALVCSNLILNGFDDWVLPSLSELNSVLTSVPVTNNVWYWSSYGTGNLICQRNTGGVISQTSWSSSIYNYIRAIRYF